MKQFLKTIWAIFIVIALFFTYYGFWEHNLIMICLAFMPQAINFGYSFAKELDN